VKQIKSADCHCLSLASIDIISIACKLCAFALRSKCRVFIGHISSGVTPACLPVVFIGSDYCSARLLSDCCGLMCKSHALFNTYRINKLTDMIQRTMQATPQAVCELSYKQSY